MVMVLSIMGCSSDEINTIEDAAKKYNASIGNNTDIYKISAKDGSKAAIQFIETKIKDKEFIMKIKGDEEVIKKYFNEKFYPESYQAEVEKASIENVDKEGVTIKILFNKTPKYVCVCALDPNKDGKDRVVFE